MSISDKELEVSISSRYFKNHRENFIESIIDQANKTPQESTNEFSVILRNIILPEPRLTLSLCMLASFLIGIVTNQSIDTTLGLGNEISEFMYYGGELI